MVGFGVSVGGDVGVGIAVDVTATVGEGVSVEGGTADGTKVAVAVSAGSGVSAGGWVADGQIVGGRSDPLPRGGQWVEREVGGNTFRAVNHR